MLTTAALGNLRWTRSALLDHTQMLTQTSVPVVPSQRAIATLGQLKCVCVKFKIWADGRWGGFPRHLGFRQTVDCDLSICLSSLWHKATGSSKHTQISLLSRYYFQHLQDSVLHEDFAGWLEIFLQQWQSSKNVKILVKRLMRVFWFKCFFGGVGGIWE